MSSSLSASNGNNANSSTAEANQKISVLSVSSSSQEGSSRADGAYEQFWNVKDPFLLAKKVIDKSAARKYFRFEELYKDFYCKTNESVKVDSKAKDHRRKIIKEIAAKKLLLNIIAEKDTKMIKFKIMRKLIRRKLREPKPISLEDSVMIWMHCSRSVDVMRDNQGYYKRLLDQHYVDFFANQITQDVKRSSTLVTQPSHLDAMQRIFIAYARRNACIGYCQGLNYIVAKFLSFNLAEEECFWLLTQLLENVLPLDYFPNMMMGVVCDLKIMESLLRKKSPKLFKKLQTFEANVLNILLTQWVVCLFTQVLDDSLLVIAWNWLFAKGSTAIFSVCLVMLEYCETEFLKAKSLEVVKVVEKKLREWKDTKKFTKKLKKVYINEKGVNFMRELYKQICMLELEQKKQMSKRRQSNSDRSNHLLAKNRIECDAKLPVCHELMTRQNQRNNAELPPDFFVFKTQRSLVILEDYFHVGKGADKRNVGLDGGDILQTMQEHICGSEDNEQLSIQKMENKQKLEQEEQQQLKKMQSLRDAEEVKTEEVDRVDELSSRTRNNNSSDLQPEQQNQQLVLVQRDSTGSDSENIDELLDNSKSFKFFSNISKTKNNYTYLVPSRRKTIDINGQEVFRQTMTMKQLPNVEEEEQMY